jgi:hypothetical protein
MRGLNVSKWILGVLCLLGFVFPVANASPAVIDNLYYNLSSLSDAELEVDWTRYDGGSSRAGIQINSTGNTLYYTNTSLDLTNNNAFLFDAVVSGSALGVDGELGARMWVKVRQPSMPPATFYHIEMRFVKQSGQYRIDLADGTGGLIAWLNKDWTSLTPRYRVRLGHQQIGGIDYIIFQAENPALWDSFGRLKNPDATNSVSVPLSSFGIGGGPGGFGFGNVNNGVYYSEWEWLSIIYSDEADTVLPTTSGFAPASNLLENVLLGSVLAALGLYAVYKRRRLRNRTA